MRTVRERYVMSRFLRWMTAALLITLSTTAAAQALPFRDRPAPAAVRVSDVLSALGSWLAPFLGLPGGLLSASGNTTTVSPKTTLDDGSAIGGFPTFSEGSHLDPNGGRR